MEGTRRQRRATREGVDVRTGLTRRRRAPQGARGGWRGGNGPAREAEAQRPRPRALATVKQARARTTASQADAGARGSG